MRYPVWLPYPSCWLKAIFLEFYVFPFYAIAWVADRVAFMSKIVWMFRNDSIEWWAWTWLFLFALLIPVFFLSHIYQFFWGEPAKNFPWWIPSLRSWLEGFWHWWVFVTSAVTMLFVIFVLVYKLEPPYPITEEEFILMPWGFPIVAAYLYHFRLLTERGIRRAIAKRKYSQPQ